MWGWTIKKAEHHRIEAFELWCWWRFLDIKEIKLVSPKGIQPWIFIGRTDAEAEAPILWAPDVKNWFFGKDPDAGKDWKQKEKKVTEDERMRWLDCIIASVDMILSKLREIVKDSHGVLQPWGQKELDTT